MMTPQMERERLREWLESQGRTAEKAAEMTARQAPPSDIDSFGHEQAHRTSAAYQQSANNYFDAAAHLRAAPSQPMPSEVEKRLRGMGDLLDALGECSLSARAGLILEDLRHHHARASAALSGAAPGEQPQGETVVVDMMSALPSKPLAPAASDLDAIVEDGNTRLEDFSPETLAKLVRKRDAQLAAHGWMPKEGK